MFGLATVHASSILLDSKKGSFTNRLDCAKETWKNDAKLMLTTVAPTAAVATAAVLKPSILTKAAQYVGKGLTKVLGKLGPKITANGLVQKILKNPTKAGGIGLIAAGALYVIDALTKHSYKAGQIDQKYTDAAAIESQTKRVVLA